MIEDYTAPNRFQRCPSAKPVKPTGRKLASQTVVCAAESLMRLAETKLKPTDGELGEVFQHESFAAASELDQATILSQSSIAKYESELNYGWDCYFGINLAPDLVGCSALDLGCFCGGRSIAWLERYNLDRIKVLT